MFAKRLIKDSVGSVLSVVCAMGVLMPQTVQAGFDWTPPPAPVVMAPSQQAPAPAQQGPLTPELDSALPVPVGNVEAAPVHPTPAPAPVQQSEPLVLDNTAPAPTAEKIEELPVMAEPAPAPAPAPAPVQSSMPTRVAEPAPTAPAAVSDDVIEGFGKDIPLAIALRDIVPSQYAYSFTPRDIAGAKISWRGGKPWQDVLKSALAPYDFDMAVTENQIFIFAKQYNGATAPAADPAPSAPPQPSAQPSSTEEPLPLVEPQTAPQQEAAMKSVPAKAPVASAMDLDAVRKWQARPGTTLRQTLEAWTKENNVELNWSTPYDYPITNAFYFDGKFTQAVESLLSAYGGEHPSPKGKLYPNLPEGPSVLMIN